MRFITPLWFIRVLALFCLALLSSCPLYGQEAEVKSCAADFFGKVVGDWIGVCEQTTDGEKADDKYFHATVTRKDANTFETYFEYFRADKTGAPVRAGESTAITTIRDGVASSKVTGKGFVLVYQKPKSQRHEIQEVTRGVTRDSLRSDGKGSISVMGMPLGLGKNGKADVKTTWSINGDSFTIRQKVKIVFRALFIKKTFDVTANYTAHRGADVAQLMTRRGASAQASRAAFQ